ncbi:T9SS type A sorting domain-containing protein [Sediminibacterium sp.]|uniref:T9SS type A sorting domain-containing protein n=1 Tax=Sediminibacterium sp. TaxID=1917865 RepID=UPI0027339B5F|nr:T9SS type A sorting domain-containing protein [Sediminibacterium sp.]MDP3567382.1 T9SS type A sorting domain-containing protein [Sediminibacterium sp.]
MTTSNLIIRIPEPCHEDWNNMGPHAKGKFCSSCSKAVFDFSNKTDNEIKSILIEHKDQKVCGHFKKTQVNRPLNISFNLNNLPKNVSSTKAFAIALFLVFGSFLFSCTDLHGQKIESIEVVNSKLEEHMLGEMKMPLIETMRGDTIFQEDSISTTCSKNEYVDGGISFEEVPAIHEVIPETEIFVLGQMATFVETKDSAMTDVVDTTSANKIEFKNPTTEFTTQKELLVYPNPSNGEFTIKYSVLKRANIIIDIFDVNGALLKNIVNQNNQFEGNYQIPVNSNDLPNGIYLVRLINNGKRFTERVIIEK